MTYTIELEITDLPPEYRAETEPTQLKLHEDLATLATKMSGVDSGDRENAVGIAIVEALERRQMIEAGDSSPDTDTQDRTPRGKRDLREHTK